MNRRMLAVSLGVGAVCLLTEASLLAKPVLLGWPDRPATFTYGGFVVSPQGTPVSGVEVTATHHRDAHSFSYVDVVTTDASGHFLINRAQAISGKKAADVKDGTIRLRFSHPDYAYVTLEDVRQLSHEKATRLAVTLPEGRTVTGQIVDTDGQPVAGALVEIKFVADGEQRRGALTDAGGHYRFRGLPGDAGTLHIRTVAPEAPLLTARAAVEAAQTRVDTIVATPITLPAGTVVHELFGMTLCNVDTSLQAAFHLSQAGGVLVLAPGNRGTELGLQRGDRFFIVGNAKVEDFADFTERLLTSCRTSGTGASAEDRVRVVWDFSRPEFAGTNTQYLTIDAADVAALKATQGG